MAEKKKLWPADKVELREALVSEQAMKYHFWLGVVIPTRAPHVSRRTLGSTHEN